MAACCCCCYCCRYCWRCTTYTAHAIARKNKSGWNYRKHAIRFRFVEHWLTKLKSDSNDSAAATGTPIYLEMLLAHTGSNKVIGFGLASSMALSFARSLLFRVTSCHLKTWKAKRYEKWWTNFYYSIRWQWWRPRHQRHMGVIKLWGCVSFFAPCVRVRVCMCVWVLLLFAIVKATNGRRTGLIQRQWSTFFEFW